MGEYAADALRGWIKSGMPRGKSNKWPIPICTICYREVTTITRNWTVCDDGERHTKNTPVSAEDTERRANIERNV